MQTGVYRITNELNGKLYIGSTSWGFKKRWQTHKLLLNKGRHPNRLLQFSWNKYGRHAFHFAVIEECETMQCCAREQYWMDYYKSYDVKIGFNVLKIAGSSIGYKHTQETKSKMSKTRFGKKRPNESLRKKGIPLLHFRKPIEQWLNGVFVKSWSCAAEVTKTLGINNLQVVLKGKAPSAGGYQWKYKQQS